MIVRRNVINARRVARSKAIRYIATAALMVVFMMAWAGRNHMDIYYADLLAVIAEGESKGNYNAYFGNAGNSQIVFTSMTVGDVLEWQKNFTDAGHPSNAVGKYQFIRPTLRGLVDEMNISRDAVFDAALQDRLAIHLIERRGIEQYMHGRISREQFANNLSKEWAALPRVIGGNPGASYYDGDGLNHSRIRIDQVLSAIDSLRAADRA